MVPRIKKDFNFFAGAWLENEYHIDYFTVTAFIDVVTKDVHEQYIAMERLKYLFAFCLDNCVFVQEDDKQIIDTFLNLNVKVSVLPTEPFDQAIAISLLKKMSSVCENRLFVTNLSFKSHLRDGIQYLVDVEESHGVYDATNTPGWWHDVGTNIANHVSNKKEKIVKLKKSNNDWYDLGLGWKKVEKQPDPIVFTLDTEKT